MLLSVLALSVSMTASPLFGAHVAAAAAPDGVVVYLGCQVSKASLTDCKVVNDEPVDAGIAGVAIQLAQSMTLPQTLAERNAGRIVVKFTVKR
jgi:hypothetical protein